MTDGTPRHRRIREGGTGQIIQAFKNDEIDVGIALTDALIAGIAKGNKDYLLVGQYVTTPLKWYVPLPSRRVLSSTELN